MNAGGRVGESWIAEADGLLIYLAIVLVVFAETLVPPIAGGPLVVVGAAVGSGRLALGPAVAAATVGALAGAMVLYLAGSRLGPDRARAMVTRIPLIGVSDEQFDRSLAFFSRRGASVVLVGRWVPVVRSLVSIPAGIDGMPRRRFATLTAIGCAAWNLSVIGVSSKVVDVGTGLIAFNRAVGTVAVGLVAVGVVAVALIRLGRRARSSQVEPRCDAGDRDG